MPAMLVPKPRAAAVAAGRAALPHIHDHRPVPDFVRRAEKRHVAVFLRARLAVRPEVPAEVAALRAGAGKEGIYLVFIPAGSGLVTVGQRIA